MAELIWLHEGALRRTHPVFAAANADAAVIFVWDRMRFKAGHMGVRRQLFIHETLAELDLDLFEGDAVELIPRLITARRADRLLVPASPDPAIRAQIAAIGTAMPDLTVDVVDEVPFVTIEAEPDLGRFFRYWNKARKSALRANGL